MTQQPKLTISDHAENRAYWRGITTDDILRVIRSGRRQSLGERVLHYDHKAEIGVVVNWRKMIVITVMRLNSMTRRQIKTLEHS